MRNPPPIIEQRQRAALHAYLTLAGRGSSIEFAPMPDLARISTLEWLDDTPWSLAVARDVDGDPIWLVDSSLRRELVRGWARRKWMAGRLCYAAFDGRLGEINHA